MNIRELQKEDYKKGYMSLLKSLTFSPDISYSQFCNNLDKINKLKNHKIFVIEFNNIIIASITLLIEYKFIHNMRNVGHIEDIVVRKEYRNNGYSRMLIEYCIEYCKNNNCYKILLNCDKKLQKYYEKFNFKNKNIEMSYYC